ncbi:MAG: hypothetical protein CVU05_06260 [Bacteroidetes bacterium HGW-Bacteroidetes-21]|jgi:calcineurin-like phosphoesterase family protein|nr:MAG: hypothetical protein CVU05_06260 [Bacteroidetes bacterium HGW-Bacteroidetes-21]
MQTLKFSNQTIFFTADTHYHHPNIVGQSISKWKSGFRNFDTIESMDDALVNNINEKVSEDDILFHLGDFAWGDRNVEWFRNRINCKDIYLILGNHDKEIRKRTKLQSLFTKVFEFGTEIIVDETRFVLCHYALRTWNGWSLGSIHLYGHSHGNLPSVGRSLDIGVDTNDYYPYRSNDIIDIMNSIKINNEDVPEDID